jgi:hypothetical protein
MPAYVLDRWEGDAAVVEDETGKSFPVARSLLPSTAREGDLLLLEDGRWRMDEAGTRALREQVRRRMSRLRRKDAQNHGN